MNRRWIAPDGTEMFEELIGDPVVSGSGSTSEHDRLLDQLGIGPNSTPPAPRQLPRFQSERAPSGSLIATPPVAPEELNLTPLFAYQETALARVWEAIEAGETRIILQLPTGGGKTVLAAHIARTRASKAR